MSTSALWSTLRRSWWILLVGAVVGALVAGLALLALPRTYTSDSTIMVQAQSTDPTSAVDTQTYVDARIPTYVALGTADDTVAAVTSSTGLSRDEVMDRLSFEVPPDTTVITVTATGGDAAQARATATAASDALVARITATSTSDVAVQPSVIVAAEPGEKTAPDPTIVLPAGVVAGLLIGFLVALVLGARRGRELDAPHPSEAPVATNSTRGADVLDDHVGHGAQSGHGDLDQAGHEVIDPRDPADHVPGTDHDDRRVPSS